MIPRVLLVTGSRALCDTPDAEAWARAILRTEVGTLPTGAVVVAGDARGPDAWAIEAAEHYGLAWWCFRLTGRVATSDGRGWTWSTQRGDHTPRAWPLHRNAMMVATVGAAADFDDVPASCAALYAPWAKTGGTHHTARGARRHGSIALAEYTCPAELGPKAQQSR